MTFYLLGDQNATSLETLFSEENVFTALLVLCGDKPPGPDVFYLNFGGTNGSCE